MMDDKAVLALAAPAGAVKMRFPSPLEEAVEKVDGAREVLFEIIALRAIGEEPGVLYERSDALCSEALRPMPPGFRDEDAVQGLARRAQVLGRLARRAEGALLVLERFGMRWKWEEGYPVFPSGKKGGRRPHVYTMLVKALVEEIEGAEGPTPDLPGLRTAVAKSLADYFPAKYVDTRANGMLDRAIYRVG
ncbi:MAG: hypothetical protein EA350_01370 [Gemmatimonadales bacterium]|nr:MAG: hypothetical protein EA350_01370 [Gemmatimonadales bacterium]